MKWSITIFVWMLASAAVAQQPSGTKPLATLLADGYEVKAMTISGTAPTFFLQKRTDSYFCFTQSRLEIADPSQLGAAVGKLPCWQVK